MTNSAVLDSVHRASDLIARSTYCVAFTGAGISTPSGIPDFRSAGNGLWTQSDPMEVASMTAFRYHPEKFYDWLRPLARQIWAAQPNPAHQALAELEKFGYLRAVITQNIDGLHQRAGSSPGGRGSWCRFPSGLSQLPFRFPCGRLCNAFCHGWDFAALWPLPGFAQTRHYPIRGNAANRRLGSGGCSQSKGRLLPGNWQLAGGLSRQ